MQAIDGISNKMPDTEFVYSNDWFNSTAKNVWESLIPQIKPRRILEVGSYEGASACYLIDKLAQDFPIEIHCIDTWEGGIEHQAGGTDMATVELRFHHNTKIAISRVAHAVELVVHKGHSHLCLAQLISRNRKNYFDFIYIDGSHQAPDVLADAVLGFQLLKVNGIMVFDDYLWAENLSYGKDPLRCPKTAIDAFINCNFRKVQIISAPLYQLYIQKTAE